MPLNLGPTGSQAWALDDVYLIPSFILPWALDESQPESKMNFSLDAKEPSAPALTLTPGGPSSLLLTPLPSHLGTKFVAQGLWL